MQSVRALPAAADVVMAIERACETRALAEAELECGGLLRQIATKFEKVADDEARSALAERIGQKSMLCALGKLLTVLLARTGDDDSLLYVSAFISNSCVVYSERACDLTGRALIDPLFQIVMGPSDSDIRQLAAAALTSLSANGRLQCDPNTHEQIRTFARSVEHVLETATHIGFQQHVMYLLQQSAKSGNTHCREMFRELERKYTKGNLSGGIDFNPHPHWIDWNAEDVYLQDHKGDRLDFLLNPEDLLDVSIERTTASDKQSQSRVLLRKFSEASMSTHKVSTTRPLYSAAFGNMGEATNTDGTNSNASSTNNAIREKSLYQPALPLTRELGGRQERDLAMQARARKVSVVSIALPSCALQQHTKPSEDDDAAFAGTEDAAVKPTGRLSLKIVPATVRSKEAVCATQLEVDDDDDALASLPASHEPDDRKDASHPSQCASSLVQN
ncbi:MAG: hypothetical protein SGPRY_011031 [Prymnesium sp.]